MPTRHGPCTQPEGLAPAAYLTGAGSRTRHAQLPKRWQTVHCGQPHYAQVLAPAGGWPQLHAAVENGADAIYLGMSSFNARARAENFTQDDLAAACKHCHARGVRVFVTLNVLVFQEELEDVEALIRGVAEGGADAIIVQDVGVAEVARRVAPNLRVHGSTQMSVTSGVAPGALRAIASSPALPCSRS